MTREMMVLFMIAIRFENAKPSVVDVNTRHMCVCKYTLIYGWLSKSWFLTSAMLPHFQWGRLISIMWAYHTVILAKSKIKNILCGRRSSADLFSGFAAISAVTDAVATADLFLLASLLSMLPLVTVIGGLKYPLLGWPASWLAGWLAVSWPGWIVRFCRISWRLKAARQVASVYL